MPRIFERYGAKSGFLGRCRIFIPDNILQLFQPSIENNNGVVLTNTMDYFKGMILTAKRFNCTSIVDSIPDDFFFYHPNGSYTGPLGMIQRNEIDTTVYVARPDSLPFEPVDVGAVFSSSDVTINFNKRIAKPIERELTSFVTEFPGIVYCYLFIALFIFVVSLLILDSEAKITLKRILHLIESTICSVGL